MTKPGGVFSTARVFFWGPAAWEITVGQFVPGIKSGTIPHDAERGPASGHESSREAEPTQADRDAAALTKALKFDNREAMAYIRLPRVRVLAKRSWRRRPRRRR